MMQLFLQAYVYEPYLGCYDSYDYDHNFDSDYCYDFDQIMLMIITITYQHYAHFYDGSCD